MQPDRQEEVRELVCAGRQWRNREEAVGGVAGQAGGDMGIVVNCILQCGIPGGIYLTADIYATTRNSLRKL